MTTTASTFYKGVGIDKHFEKNDYKIDVNPAATYDIDFGYDEKAEDIYGYGDACPTPERSEDCKMPRRSSVAGSNGGTSRASSIGYRGEITLILPNGERTQRKTSITFAGDGDNQTKEVEPVFNMVKDPHRLWFQKEEYLHIKADIMRILEESKKKGIRKERRNTLVCTRGLESLISSGCDEARQEANSSVIAEYAMQKSRGEYNAENIKQMYSFHTIDSQLEAAERAERDNKEIQNYLQETRVLCRRMSC